MYQCVLNNGDGTFAPKVDYPAGDEPQSVFSADLDGDGDNDLAVANGRSGNVSVLSNNGDGTFAPKMDYPAGSGPNSVFSADLDGDGDNDLAVANGGRRFRTSTVSVLLNNADGTFASKVDYAAGEFPESVFSADLDGDNDLVVANFDSDDVSVLMNRSDIPVVVPSLVGDFDGDNEVGLSDFVLFLDAFGTTTSSADWDPTFDLDNDGAIGLSDFVIFLDNFGRTG